MSTSPMAIEELTEREEVVLSHETERKVIASEISTATSGVMEVVAPIEIEKEVIASEISTITSGVVVAPIETEKELVVPGPMVPESPQAGTSTIVGESLPHFMDLINMIDGYMSGAPSMPPVGLSIDSGEGSSQIMKDNVGTFDLAKEFDQVPFIASAREAIPLGEDLDREISLIEEYITGDFSPNSDRFLDFTEF